MKSKLLLIFIVLFQVKFLSAQSHTTISDVKIVYKPIISSGSVTPTSYLQCAPVSTITLKPNVSASKIYLKILDKVNNSVLYEVNYTLNQQPILTQSGDVIFKKEGNLIIIKADVVFNLKPYKYEIATEDASNVKSDNYSVIK